MIIDNSQMMTGCDGSEAGSGTPECPEGFEWGCCPDLVDDGGYPIVPPGQFDCVIDSTNPYASGIIYYPGSDTHGIQSSSVVNEIVDQNLDYVFTYHDGTTLPGFGTGNKTRYPYVSDDLIIMVGSTVSNGPNPRAIYIVKKDTNGVFQLTEMHMLTVEGVETSMSTYQKLEQVTYKDGIISVGTGMTINGINYVGIFNFNLLGQLIDYNNVGGYTIVSQFPECALIGGNIWVAGVWGSKSAVYDINGVLLVDFGASGDNDYGIQWEDLGNYGGNEMVWLKKWDYTKTSITIYNYSGGIVKVLESPLAYKKGFGCGISRNGKFTLVSQNQISDDAVTYGVVHLYDENLDYIQTYNFIRGQASNQFFKVSDCLLTKTKIMGRDSNNKTYQMVCNRESN